MTEAFEQFLGRAGHLRLDVASGAAKPYKPAMLLAAILLTQKLRPQDNLFILSELRPYFAQVMAVVAPKCAVSKETAVLPFRHLENDGIWQLVPKAAWHAEFERLQGVGARARDLAKKAAGARMESAVFERLRDDPAAAQQAVGAILAAYAPVFQTHGMVADQAAAQIAAWLPGHVGLAVDSLAGGLRTLTERTVENYLEANWGKTPFGVYEFVGRQVMTPYSAIDILAAQAAEPGWVVLELKCRDGDDRVVGQLARYRGWIAQDRAGGDLSQVRGIIVTDVMTGRLEMAMKSQVGVEVWRYGAGLEFERVG